MKITLNENEDTVRMLRKGLEHTDGYCPCKIERIEDNRCMCKEFREQIADPDFEGYCSCTLYHKSK